MVPTEHWNRCACVGVPVTVSPSGKHRTNPAKVQDPRRLVGFHSGNEVTSALKALSEPVSDLLRPRGLLNYGNTGPLLLNYVSRISGMNNEGDFPLYEAPTNRNGTVGAQAKVDDRPGQIWMFGHGQRDIEVRGRNHASAGLSKLPFYIVCDQRLIFHKEYKFARKQIQRHWVPLGNSFMGCGRYGVSTAI
jgi:hypothetical protein